MAPLEVEDAPAASSHASLLRHAVLSAGPSFARQASETIPRLFISDVYTARELPTLRALSITHIVTVMRHIVLFPVELDVQTLHVRIDDLPEANLLSVLPRTTAFIAEALKDAHARVLVHCWQGVSRSASVVAGFLIARENMTADDALQLLTSKRRIVQPNPGFLSQLRQYESLVRAEIGAQSSSHS